MDNELSILLDRVGGKMNLDDKLKKILVTDMMTKDLGDSLVAQIKQAFHDEYLMVEYPKDGHTTIMTGQEWVSRFEKEIDGVAFPPEAYDTFYRMLEAARKAGGLMMPSKYLLNPHPKCLVCGEKHGKETVH